MTDFEFYLILFSWVIMGITMICRHCIIHIITPRIDKYNGRHPTEGLWSKKMQLDKYAIAFFCPKFYKKFKGYREELVFYRANQRDLFYVKMYIYSICISALALLLFIAAGKGWLR
jgi:hypothetical protein